MRHLLLPLCLFFLTGVLSAQSFDNTGVPVKTEEAPFPLLLSPESNVPVPAGITNPLLPESNVPVPAGITNPPLSETNVPVPAGIANPLDTPAEIPDTTTPKRFNRTKFDENAPVSYERAEPAPPITKPFIGKDEPAGQRAESHLAYGRLLSQPAEHPLAKYLLNRDIPAQGKILSVAELLNGTRSTESRCQLLQAYWELSGALAVYQIQKEKNPAATKVAELEFAKAQWTLAERIKRYKGIELTENELPLPVDFPLYQKYQTFAEQLAKTDKTRYLARRISIQEQLITAQLRNTNQLDLVETIVEYNKMIAEYASATISPNVSQEKLVGAVVQLNNGKERDVKHSGSGIQQTSYRYEY